MEDSQSSPSTSSNWVTTPPPLTPCRRPTPGKRMYYGPKKRDTIKEKLLKIIEIPEKQPDEDEIFCLYLAASLRKKPRPSKEGVNKVAVVANSVQLHVWLTSQCKSNSASASTSSNSYAYGPI